MRAAFLTAIAIVIFAAGGAVARGAPGKRPADYRFTSPTAREGLPADLSAAMNPSPTTTAADTFHLAWYSFGPAGIPDEQGWTHVDLNEQPGVFFHVADGTELDGGQFGGLVPIDGAQSMWCGAAQDGSPELCGYASLPGYGNNWKQHFETIPLPCDSVQISYKIFWDSEPAYDFTYVQWLDGTEWTTFLVKGGTDYGYDGTGSLTESLGARVTSDGSTRLRFRFFSDGAWSDEDGIWPTDGAVVLDSLTVTLLEWASDEWVVTDSYFEDFEDEAPGAQATDDGVWTATVTPGFGDFADLYYGVQVLQEDLCYSNIGQFWGFFDDPLITAYLCHYPNPEPQQGAIRFGPDEQHFYLSNEIWSPQIPNAGAGDQYQLSFLVYRDLPVDNLVFYTWSVRSWVSGCPTSWGNNNLVGYGRDKDWFRHSVNVSAFVDPAADAVQIALGVWDACPYWCGIYGYAACHSQAPLFDEVQLTRVNVVGPQFTVRHIDLFQDTFAADGTLGGHARADMATDVARRSSPTILPGDSLCFSVTPVGPDEHIGIGPAAYVYLTVRPKGQPGKSAAALQAPESHPNVGARYPVVDSMLVPAENPWDYDRWWYCFRTDSARTSAGTLPGRYCFDLNDSVLSPGDTIEYVLAAEDGNGHARYFSRRLDGQSVDFVSDDLLEAVISPMEFTVLPAGGYLRGGDILYVDGADDRSGPPQLYFDTSFGPMGLDGMVDRYDVLGPSSIVNNGPASRVTSVQNQIIGCYRKIIWNTGNLPRGLIGDGTGEPMKSDDFGLLFEFLDTHPNNPGLYISGDNVAQEWGYSGASAINLRSIYMNFYLINGDHVYEGESVTPLLTAAGPCFTHLGVPDQFYAFGGCPGISDFDVLQPTGSAASEFPYPGGAGDAMISQATPNGAGSTARVLLSGFSFHHIRSVDIGFPLARVEHLRDILTCLLNQVTVGDAGDIPPAREFLATAAPNPFNPETVIRYGIRERGHVLLRIYNVAGQRVRTLVNEVQSPVPGGLVVRWDGLTDRGEPAASGVYFYQLTTGGFSSTKKMVLLR